MKNLYTYITEKILINKNTKTDKNGYIILEWPNVYNLLCSCHFSYDIINDFKNSTNDAGDVYFGCVKSKRNPYSSFIEKYYDDKMNPLNDNVLDNSIKTLQKNNPKIFGSKNLIRLWCSYYQHNNIYFILYQIYTNDGWYIIILVNLESILDEFYKSFEHDNINNDNEWTRYRYDDIKIIY